MRMILAIFDVRHILPRLLPSFLPSFKSIAISVQEKKQKLDFQDGSHVGSPIRIIYKLPVNPMLPTKFQVFSRPFGSGVEVKNIFIRWWPLQPSWISN